MPPKRTCECGACSTCRHRAYMRDYYRRSTGRFSCGGEVLLLCAWCEREFISTERRIVGHGQRYCSRLCKASARNAHTRYRVQLTKPERSCRHCGGEMPQAMRGDASYCSAECNHRAHSQAYSASRRAGAKLARIDRAYIVERDGGRCHICRRIVPEKLISIDHIVPLSRGGEHVPENLALACLPCNVRKRDRAVGEQLLLVG